MFQLKTHTKDYEQAKPKWRLTLGQEWQNSSPNQTRVWTTHQYNWIDRALGLIKKPKVVNGHRSFNTPHESGVSENQVTSAPSQRQSTGEQDSQLLVIRHPLPFVSVKMPTKKYIRLLTCQLQYARNGTNPITRHRVSKHSNHIRRVNLALIC